MQMPDAPEVRTIRADHVGSLIRPATLKPDTRAAVAVARLTIEVERQKLGRIVEVVREVWRK
jgi:hypothetical protein